MDGWSRRQLLTAAGGTIVGLGLGGLFRATSRGAHGSLLLRPPGALPYDEFLAACIRCGQCVEVCPVDALRLADLAAGVSSGSPFFEARQTPCNLCNGQDEIRCIAACPTQALSPAQDRRHVRIGVAVIDEETCWAYNGVACRVCWHACPYPNEAVKLNDRARPTVDEEICVGCGLCEHACPVEEAAITIRPSDAPSKGGGGGGESG